MPFDEETERANREKFEELLKQKSSMRRGGDRLKGPGAVAELTDYDFSQAILHHTLIVVDFWAPWCSPCRVISPILEDLASQYAGKVAFGKVNTDENPLVAAMFGIQSIPTVLIFRNGKPVDGVVGAASKSYIETKIKSYLGDGHVQPSPYQ